MIWATASVYSDLAKLLEVQADLRAAVAATEHTLEAARALDLHLAAAQLLARLGNLAVVQGDDELADARHDEALALAEEAGATLSAAFTLNWRAVDRRRAGRLDDACDVGEAALDIYRAAGSPIGVALALANLGFVAEPAAIWTGRVGCIERGSRSPPPPRRSGPGVHAGRVGWRCRSPRVPASGRPRSSGTPTPAQQGRRQCALDGNAVRGRSGSQRGQRR